MFRIQKQSVELFNITSPDKTNIPCLFQRQSACMWTKSCTMSRSTLYPSNDLYSRYGQLSMIPNCECSNPAKLEYKHPVFLLSFSSTFDSITDLKQNKTINKKLNKSSLPAETLQFFIFFTNEQPSAFLRSHPQRRNLFPLSECRLCPRECFL